MNILNHFQEQIHSIVADKLGEYTTQELLLPLEGDYWQFDPIYHNTELHYDNAKRLTIAGWCDVIELSNSVDAERKFKRKVSEMFKDAIEYQTEIRTREAQEKLNHELVNV